MAGSIGIKVNEDVNDSDTVNLDIMSESSGSGLMWHKADRRPIVA